MGSTKLSNTTVRTQGRYAIIRRVKNDDGYTVWNGTNNYLRTDERFATARLARDWAEANGYELKFTNATRKHYEEAHDDATGVQSRDH